MTASGREITPREELREQLDAASREVETKTLEAAAANMRLTQATVHYRVVEMMLRTQGAKRAKARPKLRLIQGGGSQ